MATKTKPARDLFLDAQRALGLYKFQVGERLGASPRTVSRWVAGGSIAARHLTTLARLVQPRDVGLAQQLAAAGGTTLEALGLDPTKTDGAKAPLVDSVVCAAAEAMDLPPSAVRPALLAAFRRARELGLEEAVVERTLAGTTSAAKTAATKKGDAR